MRMFVTRKNTNSSMGRIPPNKKPVEVFEVIVQIPSAIAIASTMDKYSVLRTIIVKIGLNRCLMMSDPKNS
jgi:hypothetical protein